MQYLSTREEEITFQSISLYLRSENKSEEISGRTVHDEQSYTVT